MYSRLSTLPTLANWLRKSKQNCTNYLYRLKSIVFHFAGNGGCDLAEPDLQAVIRRLDHDVDSEVSFSDFFNRMLPYFVYSGTGITHANQQTHLRSGTTPQQLQKKSSSSSLNTTKRKMSAEACSLRKRVSQSSNLRHRGGSGVVNP